VDTIVVTLKDLAEGAERLSALDWFNARAQVVFGYGWCLVNSGINPNVVRRKINETMKKPEKRARL